jgi:uncharacterized protein YecT (DUF1311 family)
MTAKRIVSILICALVAGSSVRNGVGLAQTQSQMTTDADRVLRAAEAEMATVLQNLAKKANGQPDALAKLNRAQAAWVAYRNAHIEALWPSKTPLESYGSVHPMCVLMERTNLTKERIRELRLMLAARDGEACIGAWPE